MFDEGQKWPNMSLFNLLRTGFRLEFITMSYEAQTGWLCAYSFMHFCIFQMCTGVQLSNPREWGVCWTREIQHLQSSAHF